MASLNNLDDLDYLLPGFDLNGLTVPRIRAILVSHDVSYPASAKKGQLIQILENEVLPEAKKLLRERERVRRTSEGITDMSSRGGLISNNQSTDVTVRRERESMPPPLTPSATTAGGRRGRPKRSTRASPTDTEGSVLSDRTLRRRPSRPSKHSRASDTETGDDSLATPTIANGGSVRKSTPRKLRKSEAVPPITAEETSPSIKTESRDVSVFTDDNPFQGGSSPTPCEETPRVRVASGGRRRKSTSRLSSESVASKEELRKRLSEVPFGIKQEDGVVVPTRSAFEFSMTNPSSRKLQDEEDGSDDGEFTPAAQLARETEEANRTYTLSAKLQPRQRGLAGRAASWMVILFILGGFGAWWRAEKLEIGFCGVGKPNWSLAEKNIPDWVHTISPRCEPCPPHAFCYPNLEVQCEHDFLRKAHPLSLAGVIPLPPTCEPDSEKWRRIKAVADRAVEELRDRRAKWECGHGDGAKSPEVIEPELKRTVGKRRRRGMSDEEFNDLWRGAIGEIVVREEVAGRSQGPSGVLTLTSTSLARVPIGCALRRHVRLSLLAYRLPLSILTLFLSAVVYIRSQILARRSDMARVPDLVATALDRLAAQAASHARGGAPEPWVPVGQLRDDVLRSELRGSRREVLWKRVRNVVEGNANVRAAVREGRGGDVSRSWEWIGGMGGHVDGGARRESEPVRFSLLPAEGEDGKARGHWESRKWDEGRPIY